MTKKDRLSSMDDMEPCRPTVMPVSVHSRHSSAISTSSAIRSASSSPSASPVSATGEGLSRRLSWNRGREDNLTVQGVHPGLGLAGLSRTHLMQPTDEYDLGALTPEVQPVNRPFFHQFSSDASLDSTVDQGSGQEDENDGEGRERLTASRSGSTATGHRRRPSRMYDEDGLAPVSGPAQLVASVGRSPTFRAVSQRLRKASIRVVNIMGSDQDHGMVRLDDEDEDDVDTEVSDWADGLESMPEPSIIRPQRPDPMPPEERLRGRTLGLFGPRSWTRRAMDSLLHYPYVKGDQTSRTEDDGLLGGPSQLFLYSSS